MSAMSACRHIDLATLPRFGQQVVAATATIRLVHDETLDPRKIRNMLRLDPEDLGKTWVIKCPHWTSPNH